MEKMEFPWLREMKPTQLEKPEEPAAGVSRPALKIFIPLRHHASKLGLLGLLIGLAIFGRCSNSPQAQVRRKADPQMLVASLVAIPKGHVIPVEALTEIETAPGELSKTQKLRALSPSQLEKLKYAIVAKKDIAPQTPIFWTDLALRSGEAEDRLPPRRSPRVFFSSVVNSATEGKFP